MNADTTTAADIVAGAGEADAAPVNNLELAELERNDDGNGQRLIARHGRDLIHVDETGWMVWDGRRWDGQPSKRAPDALKRAHLTARAIHDEADALKPNLQKYRDRQRDAALAYDAAVSAGDTSPTELARLETAASNAEANLARYVDRIQGHHKFAVASGNIGKALAMLSSAEPYLRRRPDQLDADAFKFNCANGTLILEGDDVQLRPHLRDDLITHISGVTYDPKAQATKFLEFLNKVQPDPDHQLLLQTWAGYNFTGDTGEQVMMLFHGKGANGKSTFLKILQLVAGDYGLTLPIQTFLHDDRKRGSEATPDLARLPGARMVIAQEPERGSRLSEAVVKTVTGGDKVIARHLFEGQFEFDPTFKLTISANEKPRIIGQDEGIWRRVILVPWLTFLKPDERDPRLHDKLKAEASGILNWVIGGYRIWRDSGLCVPDDIREATRAYRMEMDPLGQFLEACTVATPTPKTQAKELYRCYQAWCVANAVDPISQNAFGRKLSDLGVEKMTAGYVFYALELSADGVELLQRGRSDGAPDGADPRPSPPPPEASA